MLLGALVAGLCCAVAICGAESTYGPLTGAIGTGHAPGLVRQAPPSLADCPFFLVQTNLSPGVLVGSSSRRLHLFRGLRAWGLSGPTHLAMPTPSGVTVVRGGETVEASGLSEAWLLVWFSGGMGWTRWDVPWLIVLQHRPSAVILSDGVELAFPERPGLIVLMPLGGYDKQDLTRTAAWGRGLPEDVIRRCRWWASTLREFPYAVTEEFSVDFATDSLVIRSRFDFISIADDWSTGHRHFSPLSPVLGLAVQGGTFPLQVVPPVQDPEVFTPYGPYLGVEGREHVVRLNVLQYVHEAEVQPMPDRDVHPAVGIALDQISLRMAAKFREGRMDEIWDHGGPENYCWQVMGDRWYAKALRYTPEETRRRAVAALREYFRDYVLQESNYRPFREKLLLVGPGIGTWGGYDDAGKFSSNLLETLWCYAHYTGDWDLIRERWPLILRFFVTPVECSWRDFGRCAIAEMGDEAAPPLSLARMAYRVGDAETYAYACYIFARELVHHYVKCRRSCAEYFRRHQPWHTPEPLPEEVYLTNLWGDVAGWQIDGPTYPAETGERQYNNRWVRFSHEDVARFHRDVLGEEMRAELDLLLLRPDCPYRPGQSTAHIAPSMEQLRSLLLNEGVDKLANILPMETANIPRPADAISYYLSFIRVAQPTRTERLIPSDQPSTPFILGLERETEAHDPCLCLAVSAWYGDPQSPRSAFPVLAWWAWPTPTPGGELPFGDGQRWVFGQVAPGYAVSQDARYVRLNWTTVALVYR